MATSSRSGFAALVGRPNAGKSTLLNRLVGNKVSIVSSRPQTTRNVVKGIVSEARGQIVILDTPGIHRPLHLMNERMMRQTRESLAHTDVVLLLLDAATSRGRGDQFALDLVAQAATHRFLLLNKIDKIRKQDLLPAIDDLRARADFHEIIPISALTGDGVERLRDAIFRYLPEGPLYYPADQWTDQPERFLAAEIIREQLIQATREELPHATAIAIDRFEAGADLTRIAASIYVERESQKAIVIGQGGQMLKEIGSAARLELEALLAGRVHLELHVKVRRKWRDDEGMLQALGI